MSIDVFPVHGKKNKQKMKNKRRKFRLIAPYCDSFIQIKANVSDTHAMH